MTADAYKSAGEVFASQGLWFEQHKILTEDGYILTAWRVPGYLNESLDDLKLRKPLVLQHGLMDCSGTWIITEEQNQLP